MGPQAIPTLDALAASPVLWLGLPRATVLDLVFRAQAVVNAGMAVLATVQGSSEAAPRGDRLLTAQEVADRLGRSAKWVYTNAATLPFAVRIDGQHPRFSERGLERWIQAKQHAGSATG